MNDEVNKIFIAIKRASEREGYEETLKEANRRISPTFDYRIFLDDAVSRIHTESTLPEKATEEAKNAVNENKRLILAQIEQAETHLNSGDRDNLKVTVLTIIKNFERLHYNVNKSFGDGYRNAQSERGKTGALTRWSKEDAEEQCRKCIKLLARDKDAEPAELWPQLQGDLDREGLAPQEPEPHLKGDDQYYLYADNSKITYSTFRKLINRSRTGT